MCLLSRLQRGRQTSTCLKVRECESTQAGCFEDPQRTTGKVEARLAAFDGDILIRLTHTHTEKEAARNRRC